MTLQLSRYVVRYYIEKSNEGMSGNGYRALFHAFQTCLNHNSSTIAIGDSIAKSKFGSIINMNVLCEKAFTYLETYVKLNTG